MCKQYQYMYMVEFPIDIANALLDMTMHPIQICLDTVNVPDDTVVNVPGAWQRFSRTR
jgi:hypothetical protein